MFAQLSTAANLALFVAAAIVVRLAGTRVAAYADAIQKRTGLGEAVVGMLLLGLITALPELGVTITASHAGNARLAVNNLIGGMALNVAILAAADVAIRREALTSAVASATPLLQGVLLVLMLSVVAAATVVGDRALFGVGVWSWGLLAVYALCVATVRSTRVEAHWAPRGGNRPAGAAREQAEGADESGASLAAILGRTALGAAAILVAGYVIAQSGDALAEATGLGQSFFGAVFIALSTSLPEITIVFASVRLGNYAMAVSNIFGANLFGLALLALADAVYRGPPVLDEAGPFATFAALLGIAVTALFLAGLLERRHAMILRIGVDSLLVVATYLAGVAVLFTLR